MTETDPSEGEWTKQVHHCIPPEVPSEMDIGSEWTCHCCRVWVVDYRRDPVNRDVRLLIPKPAASTTWTFNNNPLSPSKIAYPGWSTT